MSVIAPVNCTDLQPTSGTVLTQTACTTSGDTIKGSRRLLLVVENQSSAAKQFTVTSQADKQGRTSHITQQSLSATTNYAALFEDEGWLDSGGDLNVLAEATDIKVTGAFNFVK